jgi:hypothetical protein
VDECEPHQQRHDAHGSDVSRQAQEHLWCAAARVPQERRTVPHGKIRVAPIEHRSKIGSRVVAAPSRSSA